MYLNLLCLGIWGPVQSCVIVSLFSFGALLSWPRARTTIGSPWFAVGFCAVATLIVVPGGTIHDIALAAQLSIRLLEIMLVSAMLGTIAVPSDFVVVTQCLRLPEIVRFGIINLARFLPVAIQSVQSVRMAQRSRGVNLGIRQVFRMETYQALVVPYVISIARAANQLWISTNLRPLRTVRPYARRPRGLLMIELGLLIVSSGMWVLPNIVLTPFLLSLK